jgi:hypothetical protein
VRIETRGRVGTICLRQPCALCGRYFDIEGTVEMAVAYHGDEVVGKACPYCASASEDVLKNRMLTRAKRLRAIAEELERWSGEQVRAASIEAIGSPNGRTNSPAADERS